MKLKRPFNTVLVEVVSEVLRNILGETVASIVIYHLERDYFLRIEDIPEKPDRFEYAIKDLFREGAYIIERRITEELYRRLGLNYKKIEGYGFLDYIKEARKLYR